MRAQKDPSVTTDERSDSLLSGQALIDLLRASMAKGFSFRFKAIGFSMDPFIRDGDVITLSPVSHRGPGLGDVVAFVQRETGKLLIHRVVKKRKSNCVLRGDNSLESDGEEAMEDILGSVIRVERNNERVTLGLGPERFLIAFLSRMGLAIPFAHAAAKALFMFARIRNGKRS